MDKGLTEGGNLSVHRRARFGVLRVVSLASCLHLSNQVDAAELGAVVPATPGAWAELGVSSSLSAGWEAAGIDSGEYKRRKRFIESSFCGPVIPVPKDGIPDPVFNLLGRCLFVSLSVTMTQWERDSGIWTTLRSTDEKVVPGRTDFPKHLLLGAYFPATGIHHAVVRMIDVRERPADQPGPNRFVPVFRVEALTGHLPPWGVKTSRSALDLIRGSEKPEAEYDFLEGHACVFQKYVIRLIDSSLVDRNPGIIVEERSAHPGVGPLEIARRVDRDRGFWIPNEENEFFIALLGDHLLTDIGCCPGTRGLGVYDLKRGKKAFSDGYQGEIVIRGARHLEYWTPVDSYTKKKRVNPGDGHPGFDQTLSFTVLTKVRLDLQSFKKRTLGGRRVNQDQ